MTSSGIASDTEIPCGERYRKVHTKLRWYLPQLHMHGQMFYQQMTYSENHPKKEELLLTISEVDSQLNEMKKSNGGGDGLPE